MFVGWFLLVMVWCFWLNLAGMWKLSLQPGINPCHLHRKAEFYPLSCWEVPHLRGFLIQKNPNTHIFQLSYVLHHVHVYACNCSINSKMKFKEGIDRILNINSEHMLWIGILSEKTIVRRNLESDLDCFSACLLTHCVASGRFLNPSEPIYSSIKE